MNAVFPTAAPWRYIALCKGSAGVASAQPSHLDYQLAYQRGIEAVIWSMPAIGIREFQEFAFKDYGISWNDVVLFSKPPAPDTSVNNSVRYVLICLNLQEGPL